MQSSERSHIKTCLYGALFLLLTANSSLSNGQSTDKSDNKSGGKGPAKTPASKVCSIHKEDGTVQTLKMSCPEFWAESYEAAHPCSGLNSGGGGRPPACDYLDTFKAIDWKAPEDLINNAHRGIWGISLPNGSASESGFAYTKLGVGYNNNVPENSAAGAIAAYDAGFQSIEMDVMYVRNDFTDDMRANGTTYVGHYIDFYSSTNLDLGPDGSAYTRTVSGHSFGFVNNTDPEAPENKAKLQGLVLRDKFRRPAQGDPSVNAFLSIDDYFEVFAPRTDYRLPVVFDTKITKALRLYRISHTTPYSITGTKIRNKTYPKDTTQEESFLITDLLAAAWRADKNSNDGGFIQAMTVLKTRMPAATLRDLINNDTSYSHDEILVVPKLTYACTGKEGVCTDKDRTDALAEIDAYFGIFGKNVLFVDALIVSEKHWAAQPFTHNGVLYSDVTDYIKRAYGLRSGFWFPSAAAEVGSHGSWYQVNTWYPVIPSYERQGSDPGNQLGVMQSEPTFQLGNAMWLTHGVTTNDRPDVYLQIKQQLGASPKRRKQKKQK